MQYFKINSVKMRRIGCVICYGIAIHVFGGIILNKMFLNSDNHEIAQNKRNDQDVLVHRFILRGNKLKQLENLIDKNNVKKNYMKDEDSTDMMGHNSSENSGHNGEDKSHDLEHYIQNTGDNVAQRNNDNFEHHIENLNDSRDIPKENDDILQNTKETNEPNSEHKTRYQDHTVNNGHHEQKLENRQEITDSGMDKPETKTDYNNQVEQIPEDFNKNEENLKSKHTERQFQQKSPHVSQTENKGQLYIYRGGYARMGNLIFWYASTYGVATFYGRKPIWGEGMADMLKLFPNLNKYMMFMEKPKNWKTIKTKPVDYDPDVMKGIPEENLTLAWYTHSYLYFNHCNAELYDQLQIRQEHVEHALRFINNTKHDYLIKNPQLSLQTLDIAVVGVHVRRGDKLQALQQGEKFGHRVPNSSEIRYAMDYMRYKHKHKHKHRVIFIVASDDKRWCRENLQSPDSFVTPFSSEFDDFATIALSDHLIMTQGTFGWWAAWLVEQRAKRATDNAITPGTATTKPDVLFFKHPYWQNTNLWKTYVREHVYPEHWQAYTNHSIDTKHHLVCDSTYVKHCF